MWGVVVGVDIAWASARVDVSRVSFAELYRSEFPAMVRVAWSIVGSKTAAEDLVQDAFVRVGQRYEAIREPGAYLRRAVVNGCRNELRRNKFRSGVAVPERASLDVSTVAILDALGVLDVRQRTAIVLRYIDDRPDDEIAVLLGVRRATVRSLIFRGLQRLRMTMEQ